MSVAGSITQSSSATGLLTSTSPTTTQASLPDMRHDSTDPGTEPELDYDVLSAAAVGRDAGGDLNYLNEESVTQAIWEMVA